MNEEEKEAIECLEMVLDNETDIETEDLTNKCISNILNLIEKQQKEIKELKEKERYWKSNAIPTSTINLLYISKDKIKEIISKYVDIEEHLVYHHQELWGADLAEMIKELLGE